VEFETKTEAVEAEREDEKDPDEGITGRAGQLEGRGGEEEKSGRSRLAPLARSRR
jgi:hypothetical protein